MKYTIEKLGDNVLIINNDTNIYSYFKPYQMDMTINIIECFGDNSIPIIQFLQKQFGFERYSYAQTLVEASLQFINQEKS